jgi:hypothetical protein
MTPPVVNVIQCAVSVPVVLTQIALNATRDISCIVKLHVQLLAQTKPTATVKPMDVMPVTQSVLLVNHQKFA